MKLANWKELAYQMWYEYNFEISSVVVGSQIASMNTYAQIDWPLTLEAAFFMPAFQNDIKQKDVVRHEI